MEDKGTLEAAAEDGICQNVNALTETFEDPTHGNTYSSKWENSYFCFRDYSKREKILKPNTQGRCYLDFLFPTSNQ